MFGTLRRAAQRLSPEQTRAILACGTSGVLALDGPDGYPYAVPLSYALSGERLYFHCATEGYKLEAIGRHSKASFCVIGQDRVVPERLTTLYKSVIAFGRIRMVLEEAEQFLALDLLAGKYAPGLGLEPSLTGTLPRAAVLAFEIEHLTGKQCADLVAQDS